ncbi:hypothetical protein [Neptuniibacter sp. QD37_11]|uniref:hypothetical protein n=1 Tax=Neptuniibacter sp. QD37_11 TaxID=3398209 RepID=UPI0039F5FEC5
MKNIPHDGFHPDFFRQGSSRSVADALPSIVFCSRDAAKDAGLVYLFAPEGYEKMGGRKVMNAAKREATSQLNTASFMLKQFAEAIDFNSKMRAKISKSIPELSPQLSELQSQVEGLKDPGQQLAEAVAQASQYNMGNR